MSNWFVRYEVDGIGLMNNQVLDRMQLDDDEEMEMDELMMYGLQQPQNIPPNALFAFTQKGLRQHARLIELLQKAAVDDVEEEYLDPEDYEVIWESDDGQVALLPLEEDEEDEEYV